MLITIDYGHAGFGKTAGKRTPDGEYEWDFNSLYGGAFKKQMETYKNVTVKLVSSADGKVDTPLRERTNKANSLKSDFHISFHANANSGKWGTWGGVETHVCKNVSNTSESYKVAKKIQSALVKSSGLRDRGVKKTNLFITRETNMPSCLVECGFMDSKTDIKVLRDKAKMKKIGIAIADAVASHYGLVKKPVKTTTTTSKPATTTSSNDKYHTVKKGDTLYSIAKKYKTTVAKITKLNNLKTTTLSIGQKLKVSGSIVVYHTVKKGDTLYSIAKKYGTTVANIKKWNNLKTTVLSIGQKLIVKK